MRDLRALARRLARPAARSAVLGLAIGYAAFHGAFPTLAVPAAPDASLLGILALLIGTALLVGYLTEDLRVAVVQTFAALPFGAIVASVLVLSPAATGTVLARSDELVFFALRLGLPVFLPSVAVAILGQLAGLALRERFGTPRNPGSARAQNP